MYYLRVFFLLEILRLCAILYFHFHFCNKFYFCRNMSALKKFVFCTQFLFSIVLLRKYGKILFCFNNCSLICLCYITKHLITTPSGNIDFSRFSGNKTCFPCEESISFLNMVHREPRSTVNLPFFQKYMILKPN